MKKLTFFLFCLGSILFSNAQQNIYLNISHLLGSAPLTATQVGSNNLGNNFTIDRLEYYIGEIELHYGRGQTIAVNNTWILVDATQSTNVLLGNFNLSGITGITFGIGVDTTVNHDDPMLWPTNHPLAPRSPAMHWGWAAGYRFVALEGKTGSSMNDNFQVHALGDNNYFKQTINTAGYLVGNNLTINLNADYTQALNNITVNGNLFNHGEFNEAATLLSNFNSSVFFQGTTALKELNLLEQISISPNPSKGMFLLEFKEKIDDVSFKVIDAKGSVVLESIVNSIQREQFEIAEPGIYTINIYKATEYLGSQKLIVQ